MSAAMPPSATAPIAPEPPGPNGASAVVSALIPPRARAAPVCAAAALIALIGIYWYRADWLAHRGLPPAWTGDLDASLIYGGLLKAPRFVDTFAWWTGAWAGQVPFYRPLTSYLFWAEWKLLGDADWLWFIPGFAAHVVTVCLFSLLALRLYRSLMPGRARVWETGALIAAWGFAGLLIPLRTEITQAVFLKWKNQPDSFAAACALASLLCYLRARDGRRGALAWSAVWYLAGCGFKESVFTLPLVCAACELLIPRGAGGWRQALDRMATLAACAALFLAARQHAIGGLGYTYGSPKAGLSRLAWETAGPFRTTVATGQWLGNAAGCWAIACGWAIWRRARRKREQVASEALKLAVAMLAGWTILGGISLGSGSDLGWEALTGPAGWAAGLIRSFDLPILLEAAATAFGIAAVIWAARSARRLLTLGAAWTAAFALLLVFSAPSVHRSYLPQGGWYLLYGAALATLAPSRLPRRRAEWPDSVPESEPSAPPSGARA